MYIVEYAEPVLLKELSGRPSTLCIRGVENGVHVVDGIADLAILLLYAFRIKVVSVGEWGECWWGGGG